MGSGVSLVLLTTRPWKRSRNDRFEGAGVPGDAGSAAATVLLAQPKNSGSLRFLPPYPRLTSVFPCVFCTALDLRSVRNACAGFQSFLRNDLSRNHWRWLQRRPLRGVLRARKILRSLDRIKPIGGLVPVN